MTSPVERIAHLAFGAWLGVLSLVVGHTQHLGAAHTARGGTTCTNACAQSEVFVPSSAHTERVSWQAYPYAHQTNPSAIDPWGSTERQCVGYATWALNAMGVDFGYQDKGPNGTVVTFGNASGWAASARAGGWTVTSRPTVGAIAQWNAGETSTWTGPTGGRYSLTAGPAGHVAVVTKVYPGGQVQLSQYNLGGNRSYSTMRATAPRYLDIGVS